MTWSIKESAWQKNLLLAATLVIGSAIIFAGMLSKNRVPPPKSLATFAAQEESIGQVAQSLDRIFEKRWNAAKLEHAKPADNLMLARRLSLGLAGTIPSLEEIRKLEQVEPQEQIDWWIARLLEDRRTSDHLAERFARAFVGVADGPFIVFRRHRFVDWLSDQIQNDRPYDEIARDVLSDRGLWTDTPSVNFLTATGNPDKDNQPDPIKLAAKTSRAFLAMRIDCVECHDDFLGTLQVGDPKNPKGGEQIDFHQLAAFFGDVKSSLAGIQDRENSGAYEFRLLDDTAPRKIQPAVPYFAELLPNEGTLRTRLAVWVTHPKNVPFARSAVNRLWAVMFGKPIIEPIDNIPWGRELPEELELLANDFIENGYDLKRTLRIIAASKVFRMDSRMDAEIAAAHESNMAIFPVIRLRPEQMASSLIQATSLTTIDATANILNRVTSFGQQNEFIRRFGDFGQDEFTSRGETVTQRLLMLNGQMINERINNGMLAPNKVSRVAPNPQKMAETIYLTCLTRYPTSEETESFVRTFGERDDRNRQQAVADFYWVMLNSAEFSWSH